MKGFSEAYSQVFHNTLQLVALFEQGLDSCLQLVCHSPLQEPLSLVQSSQIQLQNPNENFGDFDMGLLRLKLLSASMIEIFAQ